MPHSSSARPKIITKVGIQYCKQVTWMAEEEGNIFTKALGGNSGEFSVASKIESKSHCSISVSTESALDVLISNFSIK